MKWFLILVALSAACIARAQSCAPGDGLFVVTATYYYADPFTPDSVIQTIGPAYNAMTTSRTFAVPPPNEYVSQITRTSGFDGRASGASMTFDLTHDMLVRARPESETLFGGGIKVNVDVYLKDAPAGTPYSLTKRFIGNPTAQHGGGPGRTDAFFVGSSTGGGTGTYVVPLDARTTHAGVTSNRHPPNGDDRYFFCESVPMDAGGWLWQSIPFCFPFPCSFYNYTAQVQLAGSIDVVPNPPVCNGKIRAPIFTGGCTERAVSGGFWLRYEISRHFDMQVDFEGDCGCCEYRQFIARRDTIVKEGWIPHGIRGPAAPPPNCDGDSTGSPCPVEDSSPDGTGCVRYGHREDTTVGRTAGYDEYPGASRATSCQYRGQDEPTYKVSRGDQYTMLAFFEGQVILTDKPGCGGPRVLARRDWVVCCSGTAGSGTSACGAGRSPIEPPPYKDFPITLGSMSTHVRFWESGGALVACLFVPISNADELIPTSDATMSVSGMTRILDAPGNLDVVQTGDAAYAMAFFVYEFAGCFPAGVSASGDFRGASFGGTFDLTAIAPPPRADFDGSGGTPDTTDITAFFSAWLAGDPTADFDRSGGTPDLTDIDAFFAAWLAGC